MCQQVVMVSQAFFRKTNSYLYSIFGVSKKYKSMENIFQSNENHPLLTIFSLSSFYNKKSLSLSLSHVYSWFRWATPCFACSMVFERHLNMVLGCVRVWLGGKLNLFGLRVFWFWRWVEVVLCGLHGPWSIFMGLGP